MRMMRGNEDDDLHQSSSIDSNTNNNAANVFDDDDHDRDTNSLISSASACSSSSRFRNSDINGGGGGGGDPGYYYAKDLSTDLRLSLSISTLSHQHDLSSSSSFTRGQYSDWPPIKALLRNTLVEKTNNYIISSSRRQNYCLFVKVYMEGIPIGRKLDLLAHHDYQTMITTLSHMFKTTILYPNIIQSSSDKCHILTYEDKEGDWMMVGDVPWEMFLATVKRMKIATLHKCH